MMETKKTTTAKINQINVYYIISAFAGEKKAVT